MTPTQRDEATVKEKKLRIIAALVSPIRRKTLTEEIEVLNRIDKQVQELYQ